MSLLSNLKLLDVLSIYQTILQTGQSNRDIKNVDNNTLAKLLIKHSEITYNFLNEINNKIEILLELKEKEIMHKELIKNANEKQLRDFIVDTLSMIKETNTDLYDKLEMHLYREIYGCHFSQWLLDKATSKMKNEDTTTGAHWTVEQTNQIANNHNLVYKEFNEFDFNYVMNMIYSDFYGAVSNNADTYYQMALKFLNDKDGKEGKAISYFFM